MASLPHVGLHSLLVFGDFGRASFVMALVNGLIKPSPSSPSNAIKTFRFSTSWSAWFFSRFAFISLSRIARVMKKFFNNSNAEMRQWKKQEQSLNLATHVGCEAQFHIFSDFLLCVSGELLVNVFPVLSIKTFPCLGSQQRSVKWLLASFFELTWTVFYDFGFYQTPDRHSP